MSDIEKYSINRSVNGKLETRFCYRIDKRVGAATNDETDENAECYTEFKLTHENEIPFDEYQVIHSGLLKRDLAKEFEIPEEYFASVTAEEYDRETEAGGAEP